jgi:multicomponent Na+:H+ antiporter subunit C
MLEFVLERAGYWAIIGLMMVGLYISFSAENLIKRLVGVSLFQTSVCLFFVLLGYVRGGTAPILMGQDAVYVAKSPPAGGGYGEAGEVAAASAGRFAELQHVYANPLPHVLILTAIVVGVATLAVGLALIVRIREAYGTIEADDMRVIDIETALAQEAELEKERREAAA